MPYSYNLPNHALFLTSRDGSFNAFNEYYNAVSSVFTSSFLKDLKINCDDMSDGALNTYCTVNFITVNKI